jgi:hypothetical protein
LPEIQVRNAADIFRSSYVEVYIKHSAAKRGNENLLAETLEKLKENSE